jgi:hypothetical protein
MANPFDQFDSMLAPAQQSRPGAYVAPVAFANPFDDMPSSGWPPAAAPDNSQQLQQAHQTAVHNAAYAWPQQQSSAGASQTQQPAYSYSAASSWAPPQYLPSNGTTTQLPADILHSFDPFAVAQKQHIEPAPQHAAATGVASTSTATRAAHDSSDSLPIQRQHQQHGKQQQQQQQQQHIGNSTAHRQSFSQADDSFRSDGVDDHDDVSDNDDDNDENDFEELEMQDGQQHDSRSREYNVEFAHEKKLGLLLERKDAWQRGVEQRQECAVVSLVVAGGPAEARG